MLLFATSAFGNELVDRTLGYLALKPIARWRIVLPKLAAAFVVGGIPVAASGFLAVALVDDGGLGGALATGVGLLVGAAAYAALFTWAGLATRHALLIGLVYVFIWEATLAAYLDGIRFLSIRRYTLVVIHGLDGARLATHRRPALRRASRSSPPRSSSSASRCSRSEARRAWTCPGARSQRTEQKALAERVVGVELELGAARPVGGALDLRDHRRAGPRPRSRPRRGP